MLRRQGLTPDQLRKRYDREIQKPFGETDIEALFGKPPYEFLGEIEDRNFPNYADFYVDYVDEQGLQYSKDLIHK